MRDGIEGAEVDVDDTPMEWPDEMGLGQRMNYYNALSEQEKKLYLKESEKHQIELMKRLIAAHEDSHD